MGLRFLRWETAAEGTVDGTAASAAEGVAVGAVPAAFGVDGGRAPDRRGMPLGIGPWHFMMCNANSHVATCSWARRFTARWASVVTHPVLDVTRQTDDQNWGGMRWACESDVRKAA